MAGSWKTTLLFLFGGKLSENFRNPRFSSSFNDESFPNEPECLKTLLLPYQIHQPLIDNLTHLKQ
jgi:hypothetical protein